MPQRGRSETDTTSPEGEGKTQTFHSPEEMTQFLQVDMQEGEKYTLNFPQVTAQLFSNAWERQITPYLDRVIGEIASRMEAKNRERTTDLDAQIDHPTNNVLVFSFVFSPRNHTDLR